MQKSEQMVVQGWHAQHGQHMQNFILIQATSTTPATSPHLSVLFWPAVHNALHVHSGVLLTGTCWSTLRGTTDMVQIDWN